MRTQGIVRQSGVARSPSLVGLDGLTLRLDSGSLRPFLMEVSGSVESGFGPIDAAELSSRARAIEAGREVEWRFLTTFLGRLSPLVVRIARGDDARLNIHFFGGAALIDAILGCAKPV